jgi:16S rRNA G966 N2-methylase RsmD
VKVGQGKRNDKTSATVAEVAQELGVATRTARYRLKIAEQLSPHPDLAEKVDSGAMEAKRALRVVRTRERAVPTRGQRKALPKDSRIERCDFRKLRLEPSSVDLIFCDPPYTREYLPLWSDLSKFAARVLKPGRLLITYAGQWALPELLARLTEHLRYVWIGSVHHRAHQHDQYMAAKIWVHSKPLLFFSNGPYKPSRWFADSVLGSGAEKDHHEWQQSVGEAEWFIKALTEPGDLVVDPCMGSGTTAVASARLGRQFVGSDVDRQAVRTARSRL